jgi:alpha-tubulin suppressor-like RCC1 family protein
MQLSSRLSSVGAALTVMTLLGGCGILDRDTLPSPSSLGLLVSHGDSARAGVPLEHQPVVQVLDASGRPVSVGGLQITAALTFGGGILLGTETQTTSSSGAATFTDLSIRGAVGAYTVTFSSLPLKSIATSIALKAGPAAAIAVRDGDAQTAAAGTSVATLPAVLVSDADSNPVGGVTVAFDILTGGGSLVGQATAKTNAMGVATAGGWTLGRRLGSNSLSASIPSTIIPPAIFTATAIVGAAAKVVVTSGPASARDRIALTLPLVVQLQDAVGNAAPTAGIVVTASIASGGGKLRGTLVVPTTSAGTSTFTDISIAGVAGPRTIRFSASGLAADSVGVTLLAGEPASIAVVAGNDQVTLTGAAVTVSPAVLVADSDGNRIDGRLVSFAVTGGGGSVTGASPMTDASGVARLGSWTLGALAGANTLAASVPGLPPAVFTSTGLAPAVAVDSTVFDLVSDSVTRAAGTFVFRQSGTAVPPDSGSVIVGAQGGGFIRKVVGVENAGSMIRLQTVPASLDEVIRNDSVVIHLELGGASASRGRAIAPAPTFTPSSVAISGGNGEYTITNLRLQGAESSTDGLVITSATFSLHPTFDFRSVWSEFLQAPKVHLAVGAAVGFNTLYTIGFSSDWQGVASIPLGILSFPFTIPAGGVPLPATAEVMLTLKMSTVAEGAAAFQWGWTSTATASIGADWSSPTGFLPTGTASLSMTPQLTNAKIDAGLSASLELELRPRIVIAESVAGELWASNYASANAIVDLLANEWTTSCHSGVNAGFDLNLTILGHTIGALNREMNVYDVALPPCARKGALIPTIKLDQGSVDFTTLEGSSPAARSVVISNDGQGSLDKLSAVVTYPAGQPAGWLAALLSSVKAPATLTLTPASGSLKAGTYKADVSVGSARLGVSNSPQKIAVSLTVGAVPVAAVAITGGDFSIAAGQTRQLAAATTDASGRILSGRTITWKSSRPVVATVSSTGLLTALGSGTVTISATSEGKNSAVTVEVTSANAFVSITAGEYHACGLTAAGAAYCWGLGGFGALGNGTSSYSPVAVPVKGNLSFTQLVAGGLNTCGLTADGSAYCWGPNGTAQIGNGDGPDRLVPTKVVSSTSFVALSVGQRDWYNDGSTCGLSAAGVVYCWGNSYTEINHYNANHILIASPVPFTSVASGLYHGCALTSPGTAYCWGQGGNGQIGDGSKLLRTMAVPVVGGVAFAELSLADYYTCGRTAQGSAYCWGFNGSGQLGDGTITDRSTPVLVQGGVSFKKLATSSSLACGLSTEGAVYCWGWTGAYDSVGVVRTSPVAMQPGYSFTSLAIGVDFSCGLASGGTVYCWGRNDYGQLGDGTITRSTQPVAVIRP